MKIITHSAWMWVLGFIAGVLTGVFLIAPKISHAQGLAWSFDSSTTGSWDEYGINSNLGVGDVVIGNRWHASSTDALSVCGFSSWWKKNADEVMQSPILNFGYLYPGHTTGTIADMTVIATSTVPANLIGTSETRMDTMLPNCMTVNSGITWAIYFTIDSTASDYTVFTKDLDSFTNVQISRGNSSGVYFFSSGDLKMGMSQIVTSEAPAVDLPENCTYGIFCPLVSAIRWLFVPTIGVTSYLNEQKNDLMTRIPFGYFDSVSSTLRSLDTTGEATTSTSIMFTASTTQVHVTFSVFNAEDIKNSIPENIRTFIHTIGSIAVWAVFFVWLVMFATSGKPFSFMGFNPPPNDEDL